MTFKSILNNIKKGEISSNYLLFGEEGFFIDQLASAFIDNIIVESEKIFNEKIIYGKETNVFTLLSDLKSFPITGSRQLIILREAQKMDKIEELIHYFDNPIKSTIFVICFKNKKIDKRKKWVKKFQKVGVLFESKLLYPDKISEWLRSNLLEKNLKIEREAEALLINQLGNSLAKINNSIEKIKTIIKGDVITTLDVQEHVGFHREYNTFELQNALAEKNHQKVILIVDYFITNPKKFPLPPIIGLLFSFFSKILIIHSLENKTNKYVAEEIKVHPFFVKTYMLAAKHYSFSDCRDVISILKDADLKFKGISSGFNHQFLKELILRIIY